MGNNEAKRAPGFITKISDLKRIIEDAKTLGLPDSTEIVFKDSDNNEYVISNNLLYQQKNCKIYLEVE